MGDSRPPSEMIDLLGSYARLRGSDVEVVINEPQFDVVDGTTVELRHRKARVLAATEQITDERGKRLVARARRDQFRNGTWALRVISEDHTIRLPSRLLVQGERPLALLWGATAPESALPVPCVRTPPESVPERRSGVGAHARAAAHRVLRVLPDQGAAVRRGARRVMRRR